MQAIWTRLSYDVSEADNPYTSQIIENFLQSMYAEKRQI